jgi:hypothetical protein
MEKLRQQSFRVRPPCENGPTAPEWGTGEWIQGMPVGGWCQCGKAGTEVEGVEDRVGGEPRVLMVKSWW